MLSLISQCQSEAGKNCNEKDVESYPDDPYYRTWKWMKLGYKENDNPEHKGGCQKKEKKCLV